MQLLVPTYVVRRPTWREAESTRHPPARRLAAALAPLIALAVMLVACSSETMPAAEPTGLPERPAVASETVAEPPVTGNQPPSIEQETPAATFTPAHPPTQPLSEREALVFLYHATGGPNWNDNTNWLSGAPLKEWHGVLTDSEGRVTGLFLADNHLRGAIPPEMGNLTNLESLDLNVNQLSGSIPPELDSLANLRMLNLGYNQLSGTILSSLGSLANLKELYLSSNQLSGSLPSSFTRLTALEGSPLATTPGSALPGTRPFRSG